MRGVAISLTCCLGACSFEGVPGSGGPPGAADAAPDPDAATTEVDAAPVEIDAAPEPTCAELPANAIAWWDGEVLGEDILGDFDADEVRGDPAVSPGKVGNATTITDSDWLTILPAPAVAAFTIEGWVRRTADDTDYQTIYGLECRGSGGPGLPRAGLYLHGHQLALYFTPTGRCAEGDRLAEGDTTLALDTWYHVAATYDGAVVQLYVDGTTDGDPVASDNLELHPDGIRIGGVDTGDDQNLVGQIDELTIYNRALGANEIAAIAAADSEGKCKEPGDVQ